jgi:hypothetical protein
MKKALLAMVAVTCAGVGVYRWQSDAPAAVNTDDELVTDRLWIDHLPRNDKDMIQIFAAITEEPVGIFQKTSQWKGEFELFRYEKHGSEMRIMFPQTNTGDKVTAKATRCDQGGMDFCLELEGSSRGAKKYYSREGWEIGSVRDIDALAKTLVR